jgi:hypothetical protein
MRRSRYLSSTSALASFEESLQVATSPGCRRSGRTMARIGLRMMPPFPSSPLSSVQRVFPSTAGRPVYQTVPYPSSASSSRRVVCIRPLCTSLPIAPCPRSKSRGTVPWHTTVQAAIAALPQGSSLRSGLCCPGPSSLSRPHAPHSPATSRFHQHGLYKMSSLCVQAATPRQPVSGSVLSWTVLCRHVIVCDPGKLVGCTYPVPSPTTLAFDQDP